jgi:hypothetical protein
MPYIGVMVAAGVIAFLTAYLQYMLLHNASERQGRMYRREYLRAVLRQVCTSKSHVCCMDLAHDIGLHS